MSKKVTDHENPLLLQTSLELSSISPESIKSCDDQDLLQKFHLNLMQDIAENEEKLRKLEYFHSKNRPEGLVTLTERWLTASQESLRKLYDKLPENKGNFQDFLNMLNIDYNVINYDPETDTFSH